MKKGETYPDWFLWMWDKGFVFFLGIGLIVAGAALFLLWRLDARLGNIEGRFSFTTPPDYQAPNLDEFAVPDGTEIPFALEGTTYVPIFSHVYFEHGRPCLLESTLSIRNVDQSRPLFLRSVRYYDTNGKLVRTYVDRLIRIRPRQAVEFLVELRDTVGGSSASFVVEWAARDHINEPIIEAAMVGTTGTQGISFRSTGQPITLDAVENTGSTR